MLDGAPKLRVFNFESQAESEEDLCLPVSCGLLLRLIIPLSHVKDQLIDDGVIILVFSERHGSF